MSELITVIVPVYNAEKYIRNCVESIQNQTYSDFELILINDGSKDDSLIICNEFACTDQRIVVIDRDNGGASAARNAGLDVAKGSYITFVDSDDYVSCDYLRNLYLAAKEGDFDIVQCNLKSTTDFGFRPGGNKFSKFDVSQITEEQALNKRMYKVTVWGKIYKKYIFDDFHFQEGIIYEDDASYYIFIDRAKRIGLLDETLYYYFMSDNSVMRNNKKEKSTDFIGIYNDRIDYFTRSQNQVLVDGSHSRFCLVLMLLYASSLINGNNINDRDNFIELFRKQYKIVIASKYIGVMDKLMFMCFNFCPQIVGRIIGRLRG